jgi:thymidylate kinase
VSPSFIDRRDGEVIPDSRAAGLVRQLLAGAANEVDSVLDVLRAHEIPPGAITRLMEEVNAPVAASVAWRSAAVADRAKGERLAAVDRLTAEALSGVAEDVAMLGSAMGRMWSSDVDVLVREGATGRAGQCLRDAGFLPLQPLLERLGRATPGVERFGAVDGTEILGSVELCRCICDYGPVAGPAIDAAVPGASGAVRFVRAQDRLHRRAAKIAAARRVTVRGVLELLALLELVDGPRTNGVVATALRRGADLEERLGAGRLLPTASGGVRAPNWTWVAARARAARRETRYRLRPRRVRVVFSGIDGAGKTTQVDRLAENLDRMNVASVKIWVRLGFSGSVLLSGGARIAQRLLPPSSHSGQAARTSGVGNPSPLTRRGPIGWAWALVNTLDYVRQSRGAARRARSRVGILDRSVLDAQIALDHDYGGELALGLHHRILERTARWPDHTFYLRLPATVAYDRKEDMFSRSVLGDLVARYDRLLPGRRGVVVLDAQRPRDELALDVLAAVSDRTGCRNR